MARSGIYAPLRARVDRRPHAIEDTARARYTQEDVGLLTGLTGPLALAVDNALWFLRLRRFGAEAERARIARDCTTGSHSRSPTRRSSSNGSPSAPRARTPRARRAA